MKYTKQANVKYSYSRPKKDLTGKKFNKLEIIEWLGFKEVGTQGKRRSIYLCKCDCGNFCEGVQGDISCSNKKSCGCLLENNKASYKGEHYSTISSIYNNYKQSAKKHNREFEISREEFISLIKSKCYYCGDEPQTGKQASNDIDESLFFYNGIDRMDNSLGYSKDNIVPCCTKCNFLKKDIPKEEFLNMIRKIYTWRIQ